MARCVDDVDLVVNCWLGISRLVVDCCLLSSDGNATFTLLLATIHDESLSHFGLVAAECIALLQQTIKQRCFAVVDVGNNCNITNILWICHNIK